MIGAVLDDLLAGARLNHEGNWSKALSAGAELDGPWSKAQTGMIRAVLNDHLVGVRLDPPRTLEQGSTVSTGGRLTGSWSKAQQG